MLTDKKVKEILDYYGVEESSNKNSTIIIDNQEIVLDEELISDIFINSGLIDDNDHNLPEIAVKFDGEIHSGSQLQYRKMSENKYYYLAA